MKRLTYIETEPAPADSIEGIGDDIFADVLKKFSGISTPIPVPVPTPIPVPVINQYVTIYTVNVREKNDPNSTKLGTIPINTTLVVNNYVANQYSYFQPIKDFPNGGYVYSAYIKKKEV